MAVQASFQIDVNLQGDINWREVFQSTVNTTGDGNSFITNALAAGTQISVAAVLGQNEFIMIEPIASTAITVRATSDTSQPGLILSTESPSIISFDTTATAIWLFAPTITPVRIITG